MHKLLAKLRIGKQILIVGWIGILGIVLIAAIVVWNARTQGEAEAAMSVAQTNRGMETGLQIDFLQARRHEKDFLLRHDPALADQQAAIVDKLLAELAELRRQLAQPEMLGLVGTIEDGARAYGEQFV